MKLSDGTSARNPRGVRFRTVFSRCLPAVRFQQSAKLLATANITNRYRLNVTADIGRPDDRHIVERLIRAFLMIMGTKLTTKMIQVFSAKDYEMVEALFLNRLHESLDVRIHVRCADATSSRLYPALLKLLLERSRQLAVAIVLDTANAQSASPDLRHKRIRLVHNPSIVWMHRGWRDDHLPGFQVDEYQHERITDSHDSGGVLPGVRCRG